MVKLWYSIFNRDEIYNEQPYFIDSSQFGFTNILSQNSGAIKKELFEYLETRDLPVYFNTTMVETINTWKTISLSSWNVNLYENYKYFPETFKIIQSIPQLVSCSFSSLAPNSKITPHCGDTNGIYRCHLGLSVPAQMPVCGFRVGNEWESWRYGEVLMFIDANNHEAFNKSSEKRFIMIFDVIRPGFEKSKHWICATVLTSLFLQRRAEQFTVLYRLPLKIQKIIAMIFTPVVFFAIPIRNFLYQLKK